MTDVREQKSSVMFSVIIPTLNEEAYIGTLLTSLVKQSYHDFEVIVVDARSKDKTVDVAKSYCPILNLRVIESKKKNVSYQRNLGAQYARGEYLVFFDADGSVPEHFFKGIVREIQKHKSMLITTFLVPNSSEEQDQIMATITNVGLVVANRLERPFAGGFNIIINRSVFSHIGGFNPKLAMSEDHEFVQRCFEAGIRMKILRDPKITINMRRFRKFGYFAIIKLYAKNWVYVLLKKSITKAMVDYPMGGQVYRKKEPDRRKYLKKLEDSIFEIIERILNA